MPSLAQAPESLFWYWVNERHQIYTRRSAGAPKPWTDDPILRAYKFTNVFRQLDRGTVWLTEHFIAPHRLDDPSLLLANIAWYRAFNWTGTGELLGWRKVWQAPLVTRALKRAQAQGKQVFTGAHIVYGGGRGESKVDAVVATCADIWSRRKIITQVARFSRSLQVTFNELRQARGVGGFIAYEIVSDLRHTYVLCDAYDVNRWANVGPGALRGLRRLDPAMPPKDALQRMRDLLGRSRENTGAHVPQMELRDIEHSLCEFDKYCRVKFGEGRPRSTFDGEGEAV
jgi:hypothetical protein